ncbi:MAG: hypothetical protein ABIR62_12220 [Dokdonella sp.]|uniref:hypothetical protein n=1 Tax=Dokdonella sp. TaxID=2291710 RepID=UPI003264E143
MTEAYRRVTRDLPERRALEKGGFATEQRALRTWIDALPVANFMVAAQRLLDGLRELNRQRLEGPRRLDALEILRPAVIQLAAVADKQIVGASFPLPPHKVELGHLALGFQAELALGYRLALAEVCAPSGSVPLLRGKQVALAAVRALRHADEHLAKACLLYRTPPVGAWQALHDVYGFIASLRLDDRSVDDASIGVELNAREAYGHALLFALANPYRSTQREQVDMFAFTRALAPFCDLRNGTAGLRDVTLHVDADRGPGYLPEERVATQRDVLVLHLERLFAFVESQIASVPDGGRTVALRQRGGPTLQVDLALLRRFVAALGNLGERVHARLGGGYMLDTVLGLHDAHVVLAGAADFDGFMRRVSGHAISLSDADRGPTWRHGSSENVRSTRLSARVLDQSLGGYRVVWERGAAGDNVRARVGELVAFALPEANPDAKSDWMVGVIRWIRIDEIGRVDAGIELLARRALAVGVRAIHGKPRSAMRGLLLASPATMGEEDYDSLIVSTEIDRETSDIELTVPADIIGPPKAAHTRQEHGLRVIEATGIYQYFALPMADVPAALAQPIPMELET